MKQKITIALVLVAIAAVAYMTAGNERMRDFMYEAARSPTP
ncbi:MULTISPECIES: hypothetical protein [unclassified Sphingopyxis]|nr:MULTISPECIES: hypothetical protein [unclassified Sphingopyxis]MDR7061211.1 hypothetical protein [Sphingopyxis sp. BE235]MDR7182058.1 hypothetical protein [Sphingopyxis sp. BE249]